MSRNQTANSTQLESLLAAQHELAQVLQENIIAVSETVVKTDHKNLEHLLEEKNRILGKLDSQSNQIKTWLLAHGFAENAISKAIASQPDNAQLLALWENFQQVINDCQLKNGSNGTIVRGRLKHTQQTLNLLTGNPTDSQSAYTAKGKSGEDNATRHWAKA